MADITCSAVNDLFQRETNRFSVDVHERYSVDGPWGRLVRVGKFPLGMGTSLTEITVERVLSGSFENSWTTVGPSVGGYANPGSTGGCIPNPTGVDFGQTQRTWNLQTQAYQTPCICLDDLKTSFEIESQIAKTVEQLTQLTKTVLDNRRRSEYLRQVDKIAAGSTTAYTSGGSLNVANSGGPIPPPTSKLTQDLLDVLRVQLIRDGAGHNALGKENGAPVLGLITSPETSRDLLRNNADLRSDLRYATPSELIAPLGVERSFAGFYHMADFEAPRFTFASNTWTQVYPFVKSATSNGYKWESNPDYNTAPYEVSFIFHPDVYEEAVQQVGPNIPGASFDDYPYYYSGQFFWLNIRSADKNPLGKIGRWLAVFQSGSRPIAPYLGKAIIHLRCANNLGFVNCTS
jgi:hypothetical protein